MPKQRRKHPVHKRGVASSAPRLKTCCETASSGPLPFHIKDAVKDPHKCMKKVTAAVWEEIQEKIMDRTYIEGKVDNYDDSYTHSTLLDEHYLSSLYFKGVQVARLHRDIAKIVLDSRIRALMFEFFWQAHDEEKRKTIILNALEYAESTTVAFGPIHRRYCPDLTISSLAVENNGHGFVDLIRQITRSAVHFNKGEDYLPIPCQAFESYYEINFKGQDSSLPLSRSKRSWQTMQQHERNHFAAILALSVLKTMGFVPESFLPAVLVEKPRSIKHCERHEIRGAFVVPSTCPCGPCQTLMKEACTTCRRYPEEIKDLKSTGFLYCQKCKKTEPSYKVPYCSRDCQKKDWKSGNHQRYCGQKLTELALPPSGWSTPPSVPPSSLPLQYYHYDRRLRSTPHLCPNPHLCAHEPDEKAIYHLFANDFLFQNDPTFTFEGDFAHHDLIDYDAVMLTPARKHLEPLLFDAIATRTEETIKVFISSLISLTLDRPGGFKDPTLQLAAEWEIEVGKMREWVEEGLHLGEPAEAGKMDSSEEGVETPKED